MPIVNNLLGGTSSSSNDPSYLPRLLYAGLILSFPGSDDQPFHQDGTPLFPELPVNNALPSYAINIFLPLNDEDGTIEGGPTEFISGSHAVQADDVMEAIDSLADAGGGEDEERKSKTINQSDEETDSVLRIVSPILKQGDALLYDNRVC
jgi:ectoine hydroxylase-related dioxygenase (phytanoyl-CoA dioxygenase family)